MFIVFVSFRVREKSTLQERAIFARFCANVNLITALIIAFFFARLNEIVKVNLLNEIFGAILVTQLQYRVSDHFFQTMWISRILSDCNDTFI